MLIERCEYCGFPLDGNGDCWKCLEEIEQEEVAEYLASNPQDMD